MAEFWQTKTLEQMSTREWELLCDGCAKCCLVKLEDHDSGEIYHTNVTCELLDTQSCQCLDYEGRHNIVDDCIKLPEWHHWVTGSKDTLHSYGASLQGRVISELHVHDEDIEDHIIQWVD